MKRWPWLLALAAPAWAACPPGTADGAVVAMEPVQLAWRALPGPIALGKTFSLRVTLCPASARLVAVDATMPEHRHGMNYRPSIVDLGGGRWRVDGLLWHMPGRWEWRFDAQLDGVTHTLRQDVAL